MTTVAYVADPDFILAADGLFSGRVRAVVVPPERAIDIDTDLDFQIAELMLADRAIGEIRMSGFADRIRLDGRVALVTGGAGHSGGAGGRVRGPWSDGCARRP